MKTAPTNPFHPQFGKRPNKFIGRDHIIRDYVEGLSEQNSPHRATVVTGIRGSGKTALLSGVKEAIDKQRYVVADVTAGDELNQSILDQLQLASKQPQRKATGATLGALGFSIGLTTSLRESPHGFRYYLTQFVEEFEKRGYGVVFLIDEVHNESRDIREFASSYQHLVRDGADVALLMAGLPRAVNSVLNDKVLTFLHRAHKITLGNVSTLQVRQIYETTFRDAGFKDDAQALQMAADATFGFPYLIQLMGYYLWKDADGVLSHRAVEDALVNSKAELYQNVYELMLRETSAKDQEFLEAMLIDERGTRFGELAARVEVSTGYASKYRERLIESGFVVRVAHGILDFAPPYMREFLLQATSLAGYGASRLHL